MQLLNILTARVTLTSALWGDQDFVLTETVFLSSEWNINAIVRWMHFSHSQTSVQLRPSDVQCFTITLFSSTNRITRNKTIFTWNPIQSNTTQNLIFMFGNFLSVIRNICDPFAWHHLFIKVQFVDQKFEQLILNVRTLLYAQFVILTFYLCCNDVAFMISTSDINCGAIDITTTNNRTDWNVRVCIWWYPIWTFLENKLNLINCWNNSCREIG